jgi:predicted nucleotidyltransferase
VSGEIEATLRECLASSDAHIVAAWLFGSRARGDARDDSDVDVAILVADHRAGTLDSLHLDVEGELERRVGREVQLVVLDAAPPDLVHRVLRDGILLLDRNRSARIAFEVRSRNEYFDLLPILERYRRRVS